MNRRLIAPPLLFVVLGTLVLELLLGLLLLLLESGDLFLESRVLLPKLVVLLLQSLGNVLQSDVPLDFSLLVGENPSLELCQLRLLALPKRTLRSPGHDGEL